MDGMATQKLVGMEAQAQMDLMAKYITYEYRIEIDIG
jgi:hypothetical protein